MTLGVRIHDLNGKSLAKKSGYHYEFHYGGKQKLRNLRNICKDIIESKDPDIIEVLDRGREFVKGKFSEYGLLMMVHQAKEISESNDITFVEALHTIIDQLSETLKKELEESCSKGE